MGSRGAKVLVLSTVCNPIQELLGHMDAENCRHPSCLQYRLLYNTVRSAPGEPPGSSPLALPPLIPNPPKSLPNSRFVFDFTDFLAFLGDSDLQTLPSRDKKRNFSRQIITCECFPVKSQLSQLSSKCNVARTSETQRKVEKSRDSLNKKTLKMLKSRRWELETSSSEKVIVTRK